jgi:hypothetical protein
VDCTSKPEKGSCWDAIPRYYYDKDKKNCKKFTYGGCKGNQNNYNTIEGCFKTCGDCSSEPEKGPCRARIPRYYYDQDYKTCKRFIYGGCGGNSNNYPTKKDCSKACQAKTVTDGKY